MLLSRKGTDFSDCEIRMGKPGILFQRRVSAMGGLVGGFDEAPFQAMGNALSGGFFQNRGDGGSGFLISGNVHCKLLAGSHEIVGSRRENIGSFFFGFGVKL